MYLGWAGIEPLGFGIAADEEPAGIRPHELPLNRKLNMLRLGQ